jgi:hypothetical protein
VLRLGLRHAGEQATDATVNGDAARRMRLRIEEDLSMDDIVRGRALEIGAGQVAEILLGAEHVGALIVDIEEILQVREAVGGAHRLHAVERNRDPVPFRQREHQLGLEAALDMHVQFGLGQAGDEGVEIGHAADCNRPLARAKGLGHGSAPIARRPAW